MKLPTFVTRSANIAPALFVTTIGSAAHLAGCDTISTVVFGCLSLRGTFELCLSPLNLLRTQDSVSKTVKSFASACVVTGLGFGGAKLTSSINPIDSVLPVALITYAIASYILDSQGVKKSLGEEKVPDTHYSLFGPLRWYSDFNRISIQGPAGMPLKP